MAEDLPFLEIPVKNTKKPFLIGFFVRSGEPSTNSKRGRLKTLFCYKQSYLPPLEAMFFFVCSSKIIFTIVRNAKLFYTPPETKKLRLPSFEAFGSTNQKFFENYAPNEKTYRFFILCSIPKKHLIQNYKNDSTLKNSLIISHSRYYDSIFQHFVQNIFCTKSVIFIIFRPMLQKQVCNFCTKRNYMA